MAIGSEHEAGENAGQGVDRQQMERGE
jgi:hypothetical protein